MTKPKHSFSCHSFGCDNPTDRGARWCSFHYVFSDFRRLPHCTAENDRSYSCKCFRMPPNHEAERHECECGNTWTNYRASHRHSLESMLNDPKYVELRPQVEAELAKMAEPQRAVGDKV